MHGYFFTALSARSQFQPTALRGGLRPQVWQACDSLLVCAGNVDRAQKLFETWLGQKDQAEAENPIQTRINKILFVQFLDQQLTETGSVLINWPQLMEQMGRELESNAVDDFEQGYWLDVNTVIRPGFNVETLRQNLPEEIRSGLNWSPDRQFVFLISVLTPPPVPVYDPGADLPETAQLSEADACDFLTGLVESAVEFPQMVAKDAAIVIRARNAAVAIWLWRKYSVGTKLAANQIRIDPWCGGASEG